MPSPYPTTAQAIYDRLLADTTIAANLGVYALANGTTRPAIAVLAANEKLPSSSKDWAVVRDMPSIGGWRGSCRFPGNLG